VAIGTAREFLTSEYGDPLVSNIDETDFTVGTSALLIAKRNGATIKRAITNNGAAAIFISANPAVADNTGIQLGPGQTLILSALIDFDLASCDLYAISSGSGNAVHVIHLRLIGSR
jgi:hypothetical protein